MDARRKPLPPPGSQPAPAAFRAVILAAPFVMVLALLILLLPALECAINPGACLDVLFIGNSYTYVNDLPRTFEQLARSGGHPVRTGMLARGGWSLADHAGSPDTVKTLDETRWEIVVLQEQSVIPAFRSTRENNMKPAARILVEQVRQAQAKPLFFQTWAHQYGEPDIGLKDYPTMQRRIDEGYRQITSELDVPVVPVGDAWQRSVQQNPSLALWDTDGSHPARQGTYLAACVFYAAIFQQSPQGLDYTGGLPEETALFLQTTAAETVLPQPGR